MHRNESASLTTISRELANDTIQYLQTISDQISSPDSTEWATMKLATQSLQSRYEEIIARKEMDTDAVPDVGSPPTQLEEKCWKCAAAEEEELYD